MWGTQFLYGPPYKNEHCIYKCLQFITRQYVNLNPPIVQRIEIKDSSSLVNAFILKISQKYTYSY